MNFVPKYSRAGGVLSILILLYSIIPNRKLQNRDANTVVYFVLLRVKVGLDATRLRPYLFHINLCIVQLCLP